MNTIEGQRSVGDVDRFRSFLKKKPEAIRGIVSYGELKDREDVVCVVFGEGASERVVTLEQATAWASGGSFNQKVHHTKADSVTAQIAMAAAVNNEAPRQIRWTIINNGFRPRLVMRDGKPVENGDTGENFSMVFDYKEIEGDVLAAARRIDPERFSRSSVLEIGKELNSKKGPNKWSFLWEPASKAGRAR